jgi:hypothetical protein
MFSFNRLVELRRIITLTVPSVFFPFPDGQVYLGVTDLKQIIAS